MTNIETTTESAEPNGKKSPRSRVATPAAKITSIDTGEVVASGGLSQQTILGENLKSLSNTRDMSDLTASVISGKITLQIDLHADEANDKAFPIDVTVVNVPAGVALPQNCDVLLVGPNGFVTGEKMLKIK
jgi:hypothetical protein